MLSITEIIRLILTCLVVIQMNYVICPNQDYWSADFDSGQNCEKPDKIEKLKKNESKSVQTYQGGIR